MSKNADINFKVALDERDVPVDIKWSATDANFKDERDAKAIMISVWDPEENQSLGIDLWVDKMIIGEMNAFFYQTIVRLSETYQKATDHQEIAQMIKDFAEAFADEVEKQAKETK